MNDAKPTYVVEADKLLINHPKELWDARELFLLLVKRDFVAVYKQTVLGPLWFFIQPFFGLSHSIPGRSESNCGSVSSALSVL